MLPVIRLFRQGLPAALSLLLWLLILLQGCSPLAPKSVTQSQPDDFPDRFFLQAKAKQVYKINSQASQIKVIVRRGGLMARLGHDHVVASNHVQGLVFLDRDRQQCRAQLFAPLAMLQVDNPQHREAAAMTTRPSAQDIAGTTSNMLKSLEAETYPFAQLLSADCSGALNGQAVPVTLNIHGVSQEMQLAIRLKRSDDNQLVVSGDFAILQSDFGIEPFSVMNGLLKVQDRLQLSFELRADSNFGDSGNPQN